MYFPYLRARQFELIALRELVLEKVLQNKIIPVLEPVKESFSNLNLAHKVFQENNFKPFLIVNPLEGEFSGDTELFLDYLKNLENCHYLPSFHYKDNFDYIISKIKEYHLSECLIICFDNFTDENNLKQLYDNTNVTKIMLLDPNKNRNLDRKLKGYNKFYIRLDDIFEKQQKNADFLEIQAHKFSEEHLYYKAENYNGFSDFTILPKEFIEGGMLPRAVVIHLTYINAASNNEIWIRHFTSESNDTNSNVQGKFAEAAQKAIQFCETNGFRNSAIDELKNYLNEARYPGLGTIKKISIKNHLLIISKFLDSI